MFTVTSTFGGLEAMITGLCDEFPKTLGKHREMFVLALLGGIFLCCLPTCTYVRPVPVPMYSLHGQLFVWLETSFYNFLWGQKAVRST